MYYTYTVYVCIIHVALLQIEGYGNKLVNIDQDRE